jgi:hypothetical protein
VVPIRVVACVLGTAWYLGLSKRGSMGLVDAVWCGVTLGVHHGWYWVVYRAPAWPPLLAPWSDTGWWPCLLLAPESSSTCGLSVAPPEHNGLAPPSAVSPFL